jgi:hypothetical protein
LGREARVDAATSQKDEPTYPRPKRCVENIALYFEILENEVGAKFIVGENAADLGGGQENDIRFLLSEEGFNRVLLPEV